MNFENGIPYLCKRCGHKSTYNGKSLWFFTCGRCKTTINVKAAKKEARIHSGE